tara:strand:+ start:247 stop:576 length:330 start_codon:yes stop_codon:yes gene_type:complete
MLIGQIQEHNEFMVEQKHGKKQYDKEGRLTGSRIHNPLPIIDGRLDLRAKTLKNARKMSRRHKLDQRHAWEAILAGMQKHNCNFNWVTPKNSAVFTETAVEEIIKRYSV